MNVIDTTPYTAYLAAARAYRARLEGWAILSGRRGPLTVDEGRAECLAGSLL